MVASLIKVLMCAKDGYGEVRSQRQAWPDGAWCYGAANVTASCCDYLCRTRRNGRGRRVRISGFVLDVFALVAGLYNRRSDLCKTRDDIGRRETWSRAEAVSEIEAGVSARKSCDTFTHLLGVMFYSRDVSFTWRWKHKTPLLPVDD